MKHLIISVHGINTFGNWQERLEALLQSAPGAVHRTIYNYKYGWFSIAAFLFPPLRWLVVRRFRSFLIRSIQSDDWARIDLVGHSFGTHIIGWALHGATSRTTFKIHTVILSGSVLKHDFQWDPLIGSRVGRIVNDCGTHDNVLWLSQILVLFTGMAGRIGFAGGTGRTLRNRYFRYTHSGYFVTGDKPDDAFMRTYWLPLLLTENDAELVDLRESKPFNWLEMFLLNNLEPIKLAIYSAPIIAIALVINHFRVEAVLQRDRAESTLAAGARAGHILVSDIATQFRDQIGIPANLVIKVLREARSLVEELSSSNANNPDLSKTRALALVELSSASRAQGDLDGAVETANAAIAAFRGLSVGDYHFDGLRGEAVAYDRLGDALIDKCARPDAKLAFLASLSILERLVPHGLTNSDAANRSTAQEKLGDIARLEGKKNEALKLYQTSFSERNRLTSVSPNNLDLKRELAVSYEKIADIQFDLGLLNDARESFRRSADLAEEIRRRRPQSATGLRDASVSQQEIADLLHISGEEADALELYVKDLASARYLAQLDPSRLAWQRDLLSSQLRFGEQLLRMKKSSEARALYQQAVENAQRLVNANASCTGSMHELAITQQKLGEALEAEDSRSAPALELYQKSLQTRKALIDSPEATGQWQLELGQNYQRIANLLIAQGRPAESVAVINDQVATERLSSSTNSASAVAKALGNLAWYTLFVGDTGAALRAADEAISLDPGLGWVYANRAYALMFEGRKDEANAAFLTYRKMVGDDQARADINKDFDTLQRFGMNNQLMNDLRF